MAKLGIFKKKNKKVLLIGGALAAAWYLFKGKGGSVSPEVDLQPAKVSKGETVAASTYRVIGTKRSGMSYVPVEGSLGGELAFTPDRSGFFTRNVIQGASGLEAEIA